MAYLSQSMHLPNLDLVGEVHILLCIVFLTTISANAITGKQLYILLFLFFATLYAIRALLERLFQREKKKYIISLAYVTICMIVVIGILIFL